MEIILLTMSFFAVVCGCSLIVDGKMSAAVVPMVLSEMKLTPKMMMLFLIPSLGPHSNWFECLVFARAEKDYKINSSIFFFQWIFFPPFKFCCIWCFFRSFSKNVASLLMLSLYDWLVLLVLWYWLVADD